MILGLRWFLGEASRFAGQAGFRLGGEALWGSEAEDAWFWDLPQVREP